MNEGELASLLDPHRFTGRAGEQVRAFLGTEVSRALRGHVPSAITEILV
jgi:hypothetical protein